MSEAQSPPPSLPGFTHTRWIGGGGFADVFLFTQHSTKRPVAVKVLRAEHLSDLGLEQFQTEADTMARVSAHPYIVTILDAGAAPDGRPFIVMEHYPKPHFGLRARGAGLRLAEVLKVGVQVSAAVETAHRADVLHRDIKPANILTSAYGDPGLTDFGIAGVQVDDHLTAASGVTPGFAAPEVILDETATGSRSSDVYALAATIYALLAGRSPIYVPGGDNGPAALHQRAARNAVLPLNREDVPRSFQHLLDGALSRDPAHRPPSAAAFGQALQDIEQSLRLAPTPLVLIDATDAGANRLDRSEDDDEGTRRKVRVVDPAGPPPGRTAGRATPSEPVLDRDDPTRARRAARPSDGRGDHTLGRRSAPSATSAATVTRGGPASPSPSPAPPEPAARRSRRALLIAGAGVAAALAIGATALAGGGGEGDDDPATSTTQARATSRQDPTDVGVSIGTPAGVVATITDGTLTVEWQPPVPLPEGVAAGDLRYQVLRSDEDHDPYEFGEDALSVDGTRFRFPDADVDGTGGEACVEVSAISGSSISERPASACTSDG